MYMSTLSANEKFSPLSLSFIEIFYLGSISAITMISENKMNAVYNEHGQH